MQNLKKNPPPFYKLTPRGVEIYVRLTPKSVKDSLRGLYVDAEGRGYLKATVTVVPEDGKANKALINLLSRELKVPKSSIELIGGETFRNKTLLIGVGDAESLSQRLDKFTEPVSED